MLSKDKGHLSELWKARYSYLKQRNRCTKCGKQDAYTLNGRTKCAECLDRQKAAEEKRRGGAQRETQVRAMREEKMSRDTAKYIGLCVKCLKQPAIDGSALCEACHKKACAALEEGRKKIVNRKQILFGAALTQNRRA